MPDAEPSVASRDFALQQFLTLREEIRETKDRLFKVMTFGIIGVPAANYLARTFNVPGLLLILPGLVLIIALMYLAENHGLMRCGRFIREEVETRYPDVVGWEGWLEVNTERRSVDRYVAYSFFLLFLLYYVGTVTMAAVELDRRFPDEPWWIALVIGYGAIGAMFLRYLLYNIRTKTLLSTEAKA
jgi:hypothetical protein